MAYLFSFYFVWLSQYRAWLRAKRWRAYAIEIGLTAFVGVYVFFGQGVVGPDLYTLLLLLQMGLLLPFLPFLWVTVLETYRPARPWADERMEAWRRTQREDRDAGSKTSLRQSGPATVRRTRR